MTTPGGPALSKYQAENDLLYLLEAFHSLGLERVHQTQINALLYLAAAAGRLYNIGFGYLFRPDSFGPSSQEVNQAITANLLRKTVSATPTGEPDEGTLLFSITDKGKATVKNLLLLAREESRRKHISFIVQALKVYGPRVAAKFATIEPSFAAAISRNAHAVIDLDGNENRLVEGVEQLAGQLLEQGVLLSVPEAKFVCFFDALSNGFGPSLTIG